MELARLAAEERDRPPGAVDYVRHGISLSFDDFARVLKMPKAVLLGIVYQYSIMPLLAFLFATMFRLETEVAAGLVLIGFCPGGVASNVIAYMRVAGQSLNLEPKSSNRAWLPRRAASLDGNQSTLGLRHSPSP